MKKLITAMVFLCFIAGTAFSQETTNPVPQMDEAVRTLARSVHAKLAEKRADKVAIGQFTYQNNNTTFSSFWVNQLINELVNITGRNYTILSGPAAHGAADAEWTITGEINVAGDTIRVFTRLIRNQDRAIEGSFISNFQRSDQINSMLVSLGNAGSSSGSGTGVSGTDIFEPDSWESPVPYTIGSSQNTPVMNRYITEEDEDYFLLVPASSGRLTAETTGSMDTYMYLYNYDTEEELERDDDGGQSYNARITYNVRAGTRYLALVRGYSSSTTGAYGFRAYMIVREGASSFDSPISYEIGNGEDNVTSVRRTLESGSEDYFLLVPERDGRLTIETTGRTDTYMELYDADEELIAENDDGGQGTNALIRQNVRAGNRYVAMVRGYSSSSTGSYNFRAFFPGAGIPGPDEYEPDDEPELAKLIEIGTPQTRTFHSADDVDWVRFEVTSSGRYVINARGENNNRLDTYLELFDSNLNLIAEDDDGGDALSARISRNLGRGTYYVKVFCLNEPDQTYTLSVDESR